VKIKNGASGAGAVPTYFGCTYGQVWPGSQKWREDHERHVLDGSYGNIASATDTEDGMIGLHSMK
jgi:hypothetical protein